MTMDDQTLLRQYVRHRSETAFGVLVERHVKMVYSTALRRVRDPHLAQDVARVSSSSWLANPGPSATLGPWRDGFTGPPAIPQVTSCAQKAAAGSAKTKP